MIAKALNKQRTHGVVRANKRAACDFRRYVAAFCDRYLAHRPGCRWGVSVSYLMGGFKRWKQQGLIPSSRLAR